MTRLIDADKLLEVLNQCGLYNETYTHLIETAPTVEADNGEAVAEFKTYTGDGGICAPFNRFEFKPDFVNNAKLGDKLYTSQQKREWVDLTDEEMVNIAVEDEFLLYCSEDEFVQIAQAIQAKLKEVNHG